MAVVLGRLTGAGVESAPVRQRRGRDSNPRECHLHGVANRCLGPLGHPSLHRDGDAPWCSREVSIPAQRPCKGHLGADPRSVCTAGSAPAVLPRRGRGVPRSHARTVRGSPAVTRGVEHDGPVRAVPCAHTGPPKSERRDSNSRSPDPKSGGIPTSLRPGMCYVDLTGLEPATFCVQDRRSTR